METNYSQKLWVNTIPQTLQKKREDGYVCGMWNKRR
jgi:hypothetical protein